VRLLAVLQTQTLAWKILMIFKSHSVTGLTVDVIALNPVMLRLADSWEILRSNGIVSFYICFRYLPATSDVLWEVSNHFSCL